jgi:hypothetical protein
VHPTTVCYGLLAQEFIRIMERAGVKFYLGDTNVVRTGPVAVDFQRLLTLDTLVSAPPTGLTNTVDLVGWLNHKFDVLKRIVSIL